MKTSFTKSFERDLKKLRRDRQNLIRISQAISAVEDATGVDQISGLKRLSGGSGEFFRIRVGDFRIGVELIDGEIVFTRCLHRREIYRYFP